MSDPSTVIAVRVRRALSRPRVRRAGVAVLAVATGAIVATLVGSVEHARAHWGTSRPIAVATRDLAPGDVIDADAIELRDLPQAAVATVALDRVPTGSTVRHPVAAGEPLVPERLAPIGLTGTAALVPDGHRALSVPIGPTGAPPLATGDHVDVMAVVTPVDGGYTSDPAFPLVQRAVVVDVDETSVSVAVPEADTARVAWALTGGAVVLALAGA